jgi:hypothetical protein
MSMLVPRHPGGVNVPDGFSRSEGKAVQAATNREIAQAIITNVRLDAAAYVTNTAMNHTAALVHQAYALADGDEALLQALGSLISQGYLPFAKSEIQGMRGIGA